MQRTSFKTILFIIVFLSLLAVIRRLVGLVQEDNYVGYALSFNQGLKDLSYYDSRLFPGFPIIIYVLNLILGNPHIASFIIMFFFFILSFLLFGKITKSGNNLFIFLFPPIMLDVVSKIANEYLTIFLILLTVYFFLNKKYSLSAFAAGLCMWVRPVGVLLFPAMLISLFIYKKEKIKLPVFLSFLAPIGLFMIFNYQFFNTLSPFYQLFVYKEVSPYGNSIGFIQIIIDIYRTILFKQPSVFFSGVFYLGLFLYGVVKLVKNFPSFKNINHFFISVSIILMIFYVFVYSFNPFLENLGRYIVPIIILWWVLFKDKINIPKYAYLLVPFSIAISMF